MKCLRGELLPLIFALRLEKKAKVLLKLPLLLPFFLLDYFINDYNKIWGNALAFILLQSEKQMVFFFKEKGRI